MCLSWGSWGDCIPFHIQAWEGQDTMEETVMKQIHGWGQNKEKRE